MVYKIIGNFTDENFDKIIKKISSDFKFLYYNNTLYISLKKYESFEGHNLVLNKTFRPARDFLVRKITADNILDEPEVISEWCRNSFVALEQEKFEKE